MSECFFQTSSLLIEVGDLSQVIAVLVTTRTGVAGMCLSFVPEGARLFLRCRRSRSSVAISAAARSCSMARCSRGNGIKVGQIKLVRAAPHCRESPGRNEGRSIVDIVAGICQFIRQSGCVYPSGDRFGDIASEGEWRRRGRGTGRLHPQCPAPGRSPNRPPPSMGKGSRFGQAEGPS